TMLSGPTPFYEQLLAMAPQHQEIIARHSFRYLNVGGAVLPVATREKLDQLFGVPIIKGYGMAEIGTISHIVLQAGVPDPGVSMGRVEDIENMRVMGADGSLLPSGEAGEIVLKSASFSGYWNNPEANEAAFLNGWFRTGDEGVIDAEGKVTIIGRF